MGVFFKPVFSCPALESEASNASFTFNNYHHLSSEKWKLK